MQKLAKSLSLFRDKIEAVSKDANNPFFKSKYADLSSILDAIKTPLKEAWLALTHYPTNSEWWFILRSTLYDVDSGESITWEFPIFWNKPQEIGSSITYARRYNTVALLDIPTEDDDGNSSNESARTKTVESPTSKKQVKYFSVQDLERCIVEDNAFSKESIKQWAEDNGLTIWKPLQDVIIHYLTNWDIIAPVFNK